MATQDMTYIIRISGVKENVMHEINNIINSLNNIEGMQEHMGGVNSNNEIHRGFVIDKTILGD